MKKIVTIIGARPQFIKTALLSRELRKDFQEIVIHTGQHYDVNMSDIFFQNLDLPEVDYNLGVGSASQGKQTAVMLEKIEQILIDEKPDLVLVYGDTNSTLAGALASAKLHIPVAHVEAGMRSFNREMPEEINRVLSDHIANLLFCTSESVVDLLKAEGITHGVYLVGDVMFDLQKQTMEKSTSEQILKQLSLKPKEYILATIHRQENTDHMENLVNILKAFQEIGETIVWPVHPRTKKYLIDYDLMEMVGQIKNLKTIQPVSYTEMIELEKNARLIMTDSGGVQKEAYVAKVPCITLRNETEWNETVESGWNQLAGANVEKIIDLVKNFPTPKHHPDFMGGGTAYKKIAQIINLYLKNRT